MHVVIVGAGPSGLVLCLLLAKAGIKVTLLDAGSTIDSRPRAAHYAPSAVRELKRAGALEDVRHEGFIPNDMSFRRIDGSVIVKLIDVSQSKNPEALTVLPLNRLGQILLRHAEAQENVTIKWNHSVVNVGQDETSAWAVVRTEDGTESKVTGDFLCGCDGANSQVRRSLFGDLNYPGKTWDAQIIATNVYYPFEKFGFDDMNFIIQPDNYFMAARITNDGLWRVSYGEDTNMTYDEIVANQPAKFKAMLPGHPNQEDYNCISTGPYRIHQRCAEKLRVGRICLAADAAHLCNPFGGLGLTGGLVDVGGLFDCLNGIATGRADEGILDKYDAIRRDIYKTIIDPVSSSNFLRVSATDPATALTTDEFLVLCDKANADLKAKQELDKGAYAICHDFTQYYHNTSLTPQAVSTN